MPDESNTFANETHLSDQTLTESGTGSVRLRFYGGLRKCLLLLVALFSLDHRGHTAVMPPTPEKLISADTVALLTVPDWSKSKVGYAKSCAGRLWNDPEMKPFKEKFIQKLNAEAFGSLELGLGFGISNLLALAEGEATLVISQNGWDGTSPWQPAWLFLIETKDKSNQLKTNLTELKKKWLDSGRPIKATKIRDVEFAALAFSPGVIT